MRAAGWRHEELVDRAELRRLLPAVSDHAVGGLVARDNGFARPYRTSLAFCRAAQVGGRRDPRRQRRRRAGSRRRPWQVRCADGSAHEAPVVVNAAGAWGARLARSVAEEVPLGFHALMMIYTSALPQFVTPVVGLATRPLSFKQAESGHVMIGGGHKGIADLDSGRVTLDVERLAFSARTALELFPILARGAAGPRLGRHRGRVAGRDPGDRLVARHPGLVHAFGFCGHGFELGPVVAASSPSSRSTARPTRPSPPSRRTGSQRLSPSRPGPYSNPPADAVRAP